MEIMEKDVYKKLDGIHTLLVVIALILAGIFFVALYFLIKFLEIFG